MDAHGAVKQGNTLDQTLGAASSLDLIESDRASNTVKLLISDPPKDIQFFSDWVHEHLCTIPPDNSDSVLLETFAWYVASCAKERGTVWIKSLSRDQLVDRINTSLLIDRADSGEDNRFNKTKIPRWRDWMEFMGLGLDIPPAGRPTFYPYITERLEREITKLTEQFKTGEEVGASEFLAAVSRRMPYLDGGEHFNTAARRIGWKPVPRQLSIVLSNSLRELHDEGGLELKMYGDTRNAYTLSPDPTHRIESFVTVTLR